MEPYIDAHAHVWTPDLARYPVAAGFRREDMAPPSFTAAELLKICRPAGVGRVNLIQMSYYEFDNRYLLDMIKSEPARFVGTAIVDPLGRDPARAMLELLPKGVRAFRIQPRYGKQPAKSWLAPAGYEAMFTTAQKTGAALSCLIDPDGFPEVDRMCRRYPKAPVIIDHLGRIGVDGTLRRGDVAALCALARHAGVHVKIGAFYALGKKKPPYHDLKPLIEHVVRAFSPRRCMWESDSPFQVVNDRYQDSLALVRDGLDFLSKADREWLLARTAEQTLFRPLRG